MTEGLWSAQEVCIATGGTSCPVHNAADTPEWTARGVSVDSRQLRPGDLFIALKAARDGHDFLDAAFRAGAAAAIVGRWPERFSPAAPLVRVTDTFRALYDLAGAARLRHQGNCIAVTGSTGKTGTKEILRLLLGTTGPVHVSYGNFNNHLGVPLSLARMPVHARNGVFEIGMNHAGEIAPLSRLVRPHVAVITTIGTAHIGNLGSREAIAREKAEIFDGLMPGGIAVLPHDSDFTDLLKAAAYRKGARRCITFGEGKGAAFRLSGYTQHASHADVTAFYGGRETAFSIGLPGRHHAVNAMAGLAAADALGISPEKAASSLGHLQPAEGRGTRSLLHMKEGQFLLIDESYNASPESMAAAIGMLSAMPVSCGGRRIAVLGDMMELGVHTPAKHAALRDVLEKAGIDLVFMTGRGMRHLRDALPPSMCGYHAATPGELAGRLCDAVRPFDVVMVKGSRASGMKTVVDALGRHAAGNGGVQGSI